MQTTDTLPCTIAATIKWAVSLIGLLILSACHAQRMNALQYDELSGYIERWRAHGITNYRMRFQVNCFCDQDFQRPRIVDVRNGHVHSIVYEDDGKPASADGFHSIDSLFIRIEKSIRKEAMKDLVEVYYDAEYGYPGFVAFDSAAITGQHIDYEVKLLMIEKEDSYVSLHGTPEEIARTIYDEMVFVPTGTFLMGDLSGDGDAAAEKPVHSVTVPAFRLGKYEVTFDQWEACLADGGCNGYRPHGWGFGGNHPVDGISWNDARSFIEWLNRKTGRSYRLPTEAEWEYAARAGSDTKFSWGNDVGYNQANCDSCGSQWDNGRTAPAGSFPANGWGLHDMHGNVWEWVQDCWNDSYEGAPTDGSAWENGDCSQRVSRGGNVINSPWFMRSACRGKDVHFYRTHGFRLAHDK